MKSNASYREFVERGAVGGELLVHDADLAPHLRHVRLDLSAEVAQRLRLV